MKFIKIKEPSDKTITTIFHCDMGNIRIKDDYNSRTKFYDYITTIISGFVDVPNDIFLYGLLVFVSEMNPDEALETLNNNIDNIMKLFNDEQILSLYRLPNNSSYDTVTTQDIEKYKIIPVFDRIDINKAILAIPKSVNEHEKMMLILKYNLVPYDNPKYMSLLKKGY